MYSVVFPKLFLFIYKKLNIPVEDNNHAILLSSDFSLSILDLREQSKNSDPA